MSAAREGVARKPSSLEMQFAAQLDEAGIAYEREYVFAPPRKYRLDFAIPDRKIGIELEGGIFRRAPQGHNSITGIKRDMEKGNLLASLGWRVFRFHVDDLNDETALRTVQRELEDAP